MALQSSWLLWLAVGVIVLLLLLLYGRMNDIFLTLQRIAAALEARKPTDKP